MAMRFFAAILLLPISLLAQSGQQMMLNPQPKPASGGNPYLLSSLQGFWKLNEGTGATANDSSGNGNNGTLTGGATFGIGYCTFVSSGNSYISLLANTKLQSAPITITAWVYNTSSAFNDAAVYGNSGADDGIVDFCLDSYSTPPDGSLELKYANVSSIGQSSSTIANNTWEQVAVTYDGSTASFYINGSASGIASATHTFATDGAPAIGIGWHTGGGFYQAFNGNIRYVAVYNAVLTSSQITAIFNYGTP